MLKLSQVIKELRMKKEWTQQRLADELGITQHAVSQWENGRRVIDLETFQQVLELLDASLSVKSLNLNEAAYRLEPSTYIGAELVMEIEPNYVTPSGKEIYTVYLERSGLRLILPEFHFGEACVLQQERETLVLKALAFDYALYEDCPTFGDYLANRGIETYTESELNDFNQLKHDMELALTFFDWEELANQEL